jgi:hypothetical protein
MAFGFRERTPAQLIREIERARIHALVVQDMERARELHAHDFELTAPNGEKYTKATYLDAVQDGQLDYVVWEPISPMTVRIQGDKAVVRYRSKIAFAGNSDATTEQTHDDRYEKRDGRWQIVSSVTVFD